MGACCSTYRREMADLNARLCDLPVELKALILSYIEHVKTHHILALSSTVQEAFSLLRALPRTFDFEGVAADLADHLVRVLYDDSVRSLEKEQALKLIGDEKDRLCEYACGRNFEVLKWAHNQLELPWAPYRAGPVGDDVLVLRVLRAMWSNLQWRWPEAARPEHWEGVTMENSRVVELDLEGFGLTGAVPAELGRLSALRELKVSRNALTLLPAEIGQLTSLTHLDLRHNQLTSLPAEIWQLTSLRVLDLVDNKLTSVPAEIGQLTSLTRLDLRGDRGNKPLTSVPAEIGQLTSLKELYLGNNQLTSVPAEIGQLTSLKELWLSSNQLTSVPAGVWQLTSLEVLYLAGNQLTSLPAEIGQLTSLRVLELGSIQLTSLPAEIGQLTSLKWLHLGSNRLTSVPADIGQLTSLESLYLYGNQLKSVPAAIRELRAAGCHVDLDYGVTVDE